jgi:LuxR family maltose regulon positive regulatory protein
MTESRYRWFVANGLVCQDEGNPDRAIESLDQAEQLFRPGFFPEVRPIPAMRARVWIRQGNLSEAAEWARAAGAAVTDEPSYMQEYSHLTLVRLLIAQQLTQQDTGTVDGAMDLLDRLLAPAEDSGRAGSVVEIRLLQALAHHVLGRRREALEALGAAFAGSPEPDEYVRLFLDEGVAMVELLREAAVSATSGGMHDSDAAAAVRDRVRRLLGLAGTAQPAPAHRGERPPSDVNALDLSPLSERELQVLRLLGSELSGPEMARALFISQNTLRSHTKHIFTKLGVTSRRSAVRRAHELGLM